MKGGVKMARFSNGLYFPDQYVNTTANSLIGNINGREYIKVEEGLSATGFISDYRRWTDYFVLGETLSTGKGNVGDEIAVPFHFYGKQMYATASWGWQNVGDFINNYPPKLYMDEDISTLATDTLRSQGEYNGSAERGWALLYIWNGQLKPWTIEYIGINCELNGATTASSGEEITVNINRIDNSEYVSSIVYYSNGGIQSTLNNDNLIFIVPNS